MERSDERIILGIIQPQVGAVILPIVVVIEYQVVFLVREIAVGL